MSALKLKMMVGPGQTLSHLDGRQVADSTRMLGRPPTPTVGADCHP